MKRILFIFIFFTSFETLYGQGFQAGFRTGVNDWNNGVNRNEGLKCSWEKELFGRYEIKKWAFELSAVQYGLSYESYIDETNSTVCWGPYIYRTEYYGFSSYYETGIRVYYNILSKSMAKKGIKCYFGLNTSIVNERYSSTMISNTSDGISKHEGKGWDGAPLMLGICNNIEVRLSKHINIHSFIGYDIYPGYMSDEFLRYQRYAKLSARFGVSYNLN